MKFVLLPGGTLVGEKYRARQLVTLRFQRSRAACTSAWLTVLGLGNASKFVRSLTEINSPDGLPVSMAWVKAENQAPKAPPDPALNHRPSVSPNTNWINCRPTALRAA